MLPLVFCYNRTVTYDTIFVDWDGTLSASKFWQHWANDSTKAKDHELIQERFFRTPPNLLEDWMRGNWDSKTVAVEVSKRTGLNSTNLLTGLEESCRQMQLVDPEILNIVSELRKNGTRVVIATDNMDTFTRWTVPALKLTKYFDGILNSHSLRALKKDKYQDGRSKFFSEYFAAHSIEPSRTILIDDSPRNAMVQDFGIHYVQVAKDKSVLLVLQDLI
jgi:FMN phosphatase YigB (HAD superfamily)